MTAPVVTPAVAVPEVLPALPLGDSLLMLLGVAFVAGLVAHVVFGVGKKPKDAKNGY